MVGSCHGIEAGETTHIDLDPDEYIIGFKGKTKWPNCICMVSSYRYSQTEYKSVDIPLF